MLFLNLFNDRYTGESEDEVLANVFDKRRFDTQLRS